MALKLVNKIELYIFILYYLGERVLPATLFLQYNFIQQLIMQNTQNAYLISLMTFWVVCHTI